MSKKININRKTLHQRYITDKKSSIQIAKEIGCNKVTICRYLKQYNIKRPKISKTFLIKEYVDNRRTAPQIAKEQGCHPTRIYNRMKKFNIKRRSNSESHKDQHSSFKTEFKKGMVPWNKNKKGLFKHSEEHKKRLSKTSKGKNNFFFGVHLVGELNGRWRGGISFEPYPIDWTAILKESIRQRDGHNCQICGKTTEQNIRKLDVHHIDYDKKNLNPENLITLCRGCHSKTNNNREIYREFFAILNEINK